MLGYSMGKLIGTVDNFDAINCLGFNSFDALCFNDNLDSIGYYKTDSRSYYLNVTKRVQTMVNFERQQYLSHIQKAGK
jgi:hypothetical protein